MSSILFGDSARNGRRRIFAGWWVVLASMIGVSMGPGPFAFASLGLFILPLSAEFGWSRAEISFCLTLFIIVTAACMPLAGRLVDKVGSRHFIVFSMGAMAVCLASIPAFVSELWHLALVFVLIGSVAVGTNTVSYMPVISVWFFRHRGLAIGIAISGIGLGYAYVPLLLQFLIDSYGWRSGYYALCAMIVLIGIPLVLKFLRDSPAELGVKPDGIADGTPPLAARKDVGYTIAEIVRHREFIILSLVFIVLSFVLNGMLAHMVPMLVDRGMDTGTAAAVAATEGITVFFSRIFIGYLIDRFFAPRIAMIFFSLSAIGMALFAFGAVHAGAFAAAVLLGLSLGAEVDLLAYLAGRYFGLRSFGTVYGLLFSAILLGTAAGPLAFGVGFDLTGSYESIIAICVLVNIAAVILTGFLGRYPDWESAEASEDDTVGETVAETR